MGSFINLQCPRLYQFSHALGRRPRVYSAASARPMPLRRPMPARRAASSGEQAFAYVAPFNRFAYVSPQQNRLLTSVLTKSTSGVCHDTKSGRRKRSSPHRATKTVHHVPRIPTGPPSAPVGTRRSRPNLPTRSRPCSAACRADSGREDAVAHLERAGTTGGGSGTVCPSYP